MEVVFAETDMAMKAGKYVMYILAVAGGFLIGNMLTWLICRLAAKLVLKKSINLQLERALRIIGGLVVAALVAFLLFRFGSGWGLGGSGSGEGDQEGGPAAEENPAKQKEQPKKVAPKKEDPATLASGLKITILLAKSYPKTFQFEGETEGLELAAAKAKLRKRLDESSGTLKFVDIVIYLNSTAEIHGDIQKFEAFAQEDLGLKTARKKLQQQLPE